VLRQRDASCIWRGVTQGESDDDEQALLLYCIQHSPRIPVCCLLSLSISIASTPYLSRPAMERQNLFSPRNITPPQPFPTLPQPFLSSETSSPPSHLESLFQGLGSSSSNPAHSPPVESHSTEPPANVDDHLAVTSPTLSSHSQTTTDRQNVLLNLLSPGSNPTPPRPAPQQVAGPSSPPQQVPTPPGSAHLPAPPPPPPQNDNESQGRSLLEQLMSG
jgi:hypothetical protein